MAAGLAGGRRFPSVVARRDDGRIHRRRCGALRKAPPPADRRLRRPDLGRPAAPRHDGRDALYAEWSPDGRWVAYSAVSLVEKQRTASIWIVHPDGTGSRELNAARADVYDLEGPYDPRTGRMVFTRCARPVLLQGGMEPEHVRGVDEGADTCDQRRLAAESEQPA